MSEAKKEKLLVSIITVCYNSENYIRNTIESVLHQTYDNIEYIIVDGNSNDNTLDIIKEYESKFEGQMRWISESDDGVYDAMNKGIDLMSGKWVNFMNSGDLFFNNKILEEIFCLKDLNNIDLIYGDVLVNYNDEFKLEKKAKNINEIWKGMICSHQSMLVRRELIKKNKFNKKNEIVADYEFVLNALKNDANFQYIHKPIAEVSNDGISDKKRLKVVKDYYNTFKLYKDTSVKIKIWYAYFFAINYLKLFVKKILPNDLIDYIIKNKFH